MTLNCGVCGSIIEEYSSVCSSCGSDVTASTTITFSILKEDETKHDIVVYPKEKAQLVIVKGPNIGDSYAMDGKQLALGRDPISEVFLNDVTVSRKHAVIEFVDDKFLIKDVGSLNGTYINGVRLDEAVLNHGDQLQIGKYKLLFVGGK